MSYPSRVFNTKISRILMVPNLGRWIVRLILLFVLSQMAGLLHAEIHIFHKHSASCELYEQMVQPVNNSQFYTFVFDKVAPIIPVGAALISVFDIPFTAHFFCRAPPIS